MRRIKRMIVLLLAVLGAGFVWFLGRLAEPPVAAPKQVDAIVVLTGGAARVASGVALLAAETAPRLYVSGAGVEVSAPDLLAQIPALTHGDATALIPKMTLGRARDTRENAAETAIWMRANDVRTMRLVTSYYHMPRSLDLLRKAAPGVDIYPSPVESTEVNRTNWWRSAQGIVVIGREYLKFLATKLSVAR